MSWIEPVYCKYVGTDACVYDRIRTGRIRTRLGGDPIATQLLLVKVTSSTHTVIVDKVGRVSNRGRVDARPYCGGVKVTRCNCAWIDSTERHPE